MEAGVAAYCTVPRAVMVPGESPRGPVRLASQPPVPVAELRSASMVRRAVLLPKVMHTWRRWEELTDLAHILVAMRPTTEPFSPDSLTPEVAAWFRARLRDDPAAIRDHAAGHIFLLGLTPLAISSTAIRATIAAAHSPRYLLPDPVLDYIRANKLYI